MIVAAFMFRFMALAIDVIDRRGPSNTIRCQLQPKNPKIRRFSRPSFNTSKTKHFNFKSGCVVRIENGKMRRQL